MKEKLLLLHGALGSKNQFSAIEIRLKEYYDVYSFNFEGHGGRDTDNEFSIELFSKNVMDFLESKSIEDINVFGYSMGGYVALNTALNHPEKIKKIITLGTKFNWDIASIERELKMLNPSKIEEKVPHFAKTLKQIHHPQDWKKIMLKTASMMQGMANGAKLYDSDFKKIDLPVVIGIGSLDKMVSYTESEQVTAFLPNAKLVRLEGVEHPIEKIQVDQLVRFLFRDIQK